MGVKRSSRGLLPLLALALGSLGAAERAQFDPRDLLPGGPQWKGGESDAGPKPGSDAGPAEAEAADDRAKPPGERFGSGGAAGRFGRTGESGRFEAQKPAGAPAKEGTAARPINRSDALLDLGGAEGKRILLVPVDGTIDLGIAPFIERVVKEASEAGDVAAILLDVNTFGGRVDGAVRIRDALLSSKVPTIAYVNRRAISAGALISLACDVIAVTSGATMGAATPVQMGGGGQAKPVAEKIVSYMRKEMRSTAEAKGRSGDLAEAMVDADIEVDGVSAKGKLLTLTTAEGLDLGMFDLQAETREELIKALNGEGGEVVAVAANWAEGLGRVLTDPMISGLLMTIGMLGILMELYTAGFGFTGVIGILCLCLFFLGQVAANLAGWEEVLLLIAGAGLVIVELSGLAGGLGLAGAAGAGMMVAALVMALIEAPLDLAWDAGLISDAITRVAISMVLTLLGMLVGARTLPKLGLVRRLVLETGLEGSHAAVPDVEGSDGEAMDLVGVEGVVVTFLRPFGKAEIGGRKLEVTTEGPLLDAGTRIRVVRIEGRNVVVREIPAETPDQSEEA